jgi:hypothetical protein
MPSSNPTPKGRARHGDCCGEAGADRASHSPLPAKAPKQNRNRLILPVRKTTPGPAASCCAAIIPAPRCSQPQPGSPRRAPAAPSWWSSIRDILVSRSRPIAGYGCGPAQMRDERIHVHWLYARHASVLHEGKPRSARRFHRILRRDRPVGRAFCLSRRRLRRQSLRRHYQMLSAQCRDPSAAREGVGRLAITGAEQIFSLAWNPVRGASDWIRGSLELSDGLLRTAAVLYLPKVVSCTPASRPPPGLHQSALQCHKRSSAYTGEGQTRRGSVQSTTTTGYARSRPISKLHG